MIISSYFLKCLIKQPFKWPHKTAPTTDTFLLVSCFFFIIFKSDIHINNVLNIMIMELNYYLKDKISQSINN